MGRKQKRNGNAKSAKRKNKESEKRNEKELSVAEDPLYEKAERILQHVGENPKALDLLDSATVYANGVGDKNAKVDHDFIESEYSKMAWKLHQALQGLEPELRGDVYNQMLNSLVSGCCDGCVTSMYQLARVFLGDNGVIHLSYSWALEGAIRGHSNSITMLMELMTIYHKYRVETPGEDPASVAMRLQLQPLRVQALLSSYWLKMNNKWMTNFRVDRKPFKDLTGRVCVVCKKTDSNVTKLTQCGKCKFYYYCSKECQKLHWKNGHMAECNHYCILKEYHEPFASKIREASICNNNSIDQTDADLSDTTCEIVPELELLRNKLGLTRMEDFDSEKDPRELLITRKDGTVHLKTFPGSLCAGAV